MFGGGFGVITVGVDDPSGKGCQDVREYTARATYIEEFPEVIIMVVDVEDDLVDTMNEVVVRVTFDI